MSLAHDCIWNGSWHSTEIGRFHPTENGCFYPTLTTELDVTAAETKATYEEIKAYVLEHTGLKVSCLYIAQVKAKHGIIERDCYSKSKTEDNRVPKCLLEKERAIEEALRHFQIIS